ncbi:hypothetical protein XELAEV_18041997mg [Xenopus laevis]|uniref:Endonuclease/exonuclease/phosphatase domain-containing protein n=1 Tax=Xenopus laevis TaxID=8355 RepID=A0A974C3A5_XENLA|nr:hypothetical protein XELAEV_18041997mg [Xenopus laevis]
MHHKGLVIIGGNFNAYWDRMSSQRTAQSVSRGCSRKLSKHVLEHSLIDAWRENNVGKKDFTFYSIPHKSYSRIDMMFISCYLIPSMGSSNIHSSVWSDHSMVITRLQLTFHSLRQFKWKLNNSLLLDPQISEQISSILIEYFKLNCTPGDTFTKIDKCAPDVTAHFTWDAHKAYVRGLLIQAASRKKKARLMAINTLTTQLESAELIHKTNPTLINYAEITKMRESLHNLFQQRAEWSLRWSGKKYYHIGNMADALIARKLNNNFLKSPYTKLRVANKILTANTCTIISEFTKFFQELYPKKTQFSSN